MGEWQVSFLERLGERVPVLRGRVTTYLADPDGVPSAHDFVAHMAQEMGEVPDAWPVKAKQELVDFLESEQGVDHRVDDLIEVWFIDVLVNHGVEIQELFGPRLAAEYQRQTLGYVVGGAEDVFVREVLDALPGVEPASPEPSHVMMDLARSVGQWTLSGHLDRTRRLLEMVESALGRDADVDHLVGSFFVELLAAPGDEPDDRVLRLLGPKLREVRAQKIREQDEAAPAATVGFILRLGASVPAWQDSVSGHVAYHGGRPLPHTFMGDVAIEAVELVAAGKADEVRVLLDFLESEFGVDDDVDNVIAVSFVEMLPGVGERGAGIERVLGPKLRGELERQREWSEERMRELTAARVVPPPGGLDVRESGSDR